LKLGLGRNCGSEAKTDTNRDQNGSHSLAYNFFMLRLTLLLCLVPLTIWCFPSSAMAYLGKGNELMQAERYDEAAAQFKQALQRDQTLDEARKNLAICEFELREYQQARDLFQTMLATVERPVASYYLARLDLLNGNPDSAIVRLRSLSSSDAITERSIADWRYFLGVAYFKKGQFTDAIACFKLQLKTNPRDFRAHQWLARALIKAGQPAEASQEFARARELHEYYTQGSVAIAGCRSLLNAGKKDEAWAACRPMLETDDVDKVAAIGMLFGEVGDQTHSFIAWQKAAALDPDSPELNYDLALASFQLKDMVRAKQYAQIACNLWPQFPEANVLYGTILYMLADDTEAVRILRRAEALRPEDLNVRRLLAELQGRTQRR
jgi:tetratricopeptide (TPR) repeat protein